MQVRVPRPKLRELHGESTFAHLVLTIPVLVRIPWMQATEKLWTARGCSLAVYWVLPELKEKLNNHFSESSSGIQGTEADR